MTREFFKTRDSLPTLGVGLGLRREMLEETLESSSEIDWVEFTPEGFLGCYGKSVLRLERAASVYPLISHGVNLSLGSTDDLNQTYLRQIKELLDKFDVPWWSDHVSFASSGDVYVNNLLPLPRTPATVRHFAERIKRARDFVGRPLLIENISFYMPNPPGSMMTESQFVSEILESADCGMLLDVNNVYVNSVNHNFDPFEFLLQLPLERVVQIHVAGHNYHDSTIIDTHSEAVCEPVYELLEFVLKRTMPQAVMLERDDNFPNFQEILNEIRRIRQIYERHRSPQAGTPSAAAASAERSITLHTTQRNSQDRNEGESASQAGRVALAQIEHVFAQVVLDRIGRDAILANAEAGSSEAAGFDSSHTEQLDLYGRITDAGAMATMQAIFPATRKLLGPEYWTWSIAEFYHRSPPKRYVLVHVGEGYPAFLESVKDSLPNPSILEMCDFEWTRMSMVESEINWSTEGSAPQFSQQSLRSRKPVLNPSLVLRSYSYDVASVFDILQVEDSASIDPKPTKIAFLRMPHDQEVIVFEVSPRMNLLLTQISKCKSYADLFARLLKNDGTTSPAEQIVGYIEELKSLHEWNLIVGEVPTG